MSNLAQTGNALALDSLRRRMAALHSLYEDAVSTMGPEHVNHSPEVSSPSAA